MHKLLGLEIIIINPCIVIVAKTMNKLHAKICDFFSAFQLFYRQRGKYSIFFCFWHEL